ncbi:LEA type 2 family protein [Halapricum salinum]|uniref:Water stress and hypersensitive response domain-containing protein n=1 Tax=Halapricum salinum TaxID=1457250 RepID=A0A4D6HC94_9EURY|nr:LEA type 2 family protein [Halapricum salinum]QCC51613.1 hypothetical protein DV733_10345 [Halapricum salinum]
MDVPPRAIKAAKVTAVALVALVVLLGILVATGVLAAPTVETIDNGWGEVTDDATQIETQVVVDNPNPIPVPGIIDVSYTASLNDVTLTQNTRSGIGLSPGTNTLRLSSAIPNDRIADWWVTHVNNGESSTLSIDPKVSGPGFSQSLAGRTTQIETDLLSSFGGQGAETVRVDGEPFVVLSDQQASWGEATAETTPLTFTTTVENVHDYPVTLDGVEYVVSMNDVTLGSGQTTDGVEIEPGESGALTVDASLNTSAFADWWPTHVLNNETSQMEVQLYGIVERDGERTRVPLTLYQQRLEFETDLLGDGATSVESLPSEREDVTVPTVAETERRWGEISASTAEVVTTVEFADTTDLSKLRAVTSLVVDRSTSINGVTVLDSTTTRGLPPAGEALTMTSEMDNDAFADWWVRHVNDGETSAVVTDASATVDVGITKFDRPLSDEQTQFETDILGAVGSDGSQTVTVANETIAELGSQEAAWGTADAETTPFIFSTAVENRHDSPLEFADFQYTVEMNGVTVANGTDGEALTVQPDETRDLDVRVPLSTPKLSDWWVTHLRNDERSNVSVRLYGIVERDGQRERVPIALVEDRFRLTTDLLGDGSSSVDALPTDRPTIERPSVQNTTRRWGDVTEQTTDVETDVTVFNPNGPVVNDFIRFRMASETSINGVVFGSGERTEDRLAEGTNLVNYTSVLDNEQVPAWWARHLNDGESSTVRTTTTTTVDAGFTTLSVPTENRTSTFETDLLAGLNSTQEQPIEQDGETFLVAESTSAAWEEATPQTAPLSAESTLRNERQFPITVERIDYTVSINEITLADGSHQEGTTILPGASETVELPMELDNSKMDKWWVTHVPEETSLLDVDATATINAAGQTRTVPLEMFSKNQTVETDILADE